MKFIWEKATINYIKKNKISSRPFNSERWLKQIEKKIKNKNYFLISTPLPFILINSTSPNPPNKEINIADYGSGAQELFLLLKKNKIKTKINIDSIEVNKICKYLKKKILSSKNIHINFINKYNFNKKYDYVHISDALQYNLEWKIFLKKILKKKPKMVILNNLTAGNFSTYTTVQNYYSKKMPYFFFNEKEIIKIFKNYEVIKYLFLNKILGKYQRYPQENFDRKERLNYPKTYIFIKKDK